MSPKAQRIAIAEACGWLEWEHLNPTPPLFNRLWRNNGEVRAFNNLPKYLNDLNAMHEAEKAVPRHLWSDYTMALRRNIRRDCEKPECYVIGAERSQLIADFWFYHATAAQRAEAFLRTLNLWTE